ncbi:MAG: hypothetical protein AUJ71_02790 [Candidatus Omnitrophica bacterium CG1_02_49_16]|nr:MAG: hypothetical protein AUJ71_02790 [Candidatus Omnitrophica bacterium CG1_02_49_16]
MKKIILRSLVSLFFIGFLFYLVRGDLPEIARALAHIRRGLFMAAVVVYLLTIFVMVKRLQLIFEAEELPMKYSDSLNVTFIGFFFNNFLPTAVGGDIVKAMCAARTTGDPVKSLTSVLMDRIFGLFTFIAIPSISLLFFLKEIPNRYVPVVVYSFLAGSILFFCLLFSRKVARQFRFIEILLNYLKLGAKARRIYDGLHKFKDHKALIVKAMTLSIVGQSVNIFVIYMMALALGAHTSILYFYLLVPVVHLISMLPSLNGLGIREGAYVYFLTPYMGREHAAAIGILWLGLLFLSSLIGGFIYLVRHDYHVRFKEISGS